MLSMLINLLGMLVTLLVTTHEAPSCTTQGSQWPVVFRAPSKVSGACKPCSGVSQCVVSGAQI